MIPDVDVVDSPEQRRTVLDQRSQLLRAEQSVSPGFLAPLMTEP
jgi:hypothetical protein